MVVRVAVILAARLYFCIPRRAIRRLPGQETSKAPSRIRQAQWFPKPPSPLTDESTRVARKTTSDNAGVYLFPGVPISTFDLTVTAPGFKTWEQKGIVLEVGSSIAINATMSVGTAEDEG